jgi:hypothetical protein
MSDKNAKVRFARSASRHRVPKDSIRHVVTNYRTRFQQPPPSSGAARARSTRIVFLGDDAHGQALEIMAVESQPDLLLVIHAMELREKYRARYEDRT